MNSPSSDGRAINWQELTEVEEGQSVTAVEDVMDVSNFSI